jgi:hypothetical protein
MTGAKMTSGTRAERCAFVLVAVGVAVVWSGVACLAVSVIWG